MKFRTLAIVLLSMISLAAFSGCEAKNKSGEDVETTIQQTSSETSAATDAETTVIASETEAPITEEETQPIQTEEIEDDIEQFISVEWADLDVLSELDRYDVFYVSEGEGIKVLFTPSRSVKDFKLLALTIEDVDENGNIKFAAEEVYFRERLDPECPLAAALDFFGDIPNNGFSYVDDNGTTKSYAVNISGEDGSIIMTEI